jgi:hypothetical protein
MQELVRGQLSRTGDPISESQAGHLKGTSFGASLSHDWTAAAVALAIGYLIGRFGRRVDY